MSRGTLKKILSEKRPVDSFNFLNELPKEYTYCRRTKRVRDSKGRFIKPETIQHPEYRFLKVSGNSELRMERKKYLHKLELDRPSNIGKGVGQEKSLSIRRSHEIGRGKRMLGLDKTYHTYRAVS